MSGGRKQRLKGTIVSGVSTIYSTITSSHQQYIAIIGLNGAQQQHGVQEGRGTRGIVGVHFAEAGCVVFRVLPG